MSAQALNLKALSGAELAKRLERVADSMPRGQLQSWHFATNVAPISASGQLAGDARLSDDASFQMLRRTVENRPHLICKSAFISVQLHGQETKLAYVCDDGLSARIEITAPQSNPLAAVELLDVAETCFTLVPFDDLVGAGPVAEAERKAIKARERSVGDLREELDRLAKFLTQLSQQEVDFRRAFQQQMEHDYQAKVDAMAAEHRSKLNELQELRAAIESEAGTKERAFQERVAAFDTKEAKYARRDLLKQLTALLKESESLELSRGTQQKRWWVHGVVALLAVGSGALAATMAWKIFESSSPNWHLLAPLAGGTVSFFATLIYYLKWNDRWFREHAEVELASKRYKSDIVRASWVAELVSEWSTERQRELPKELVEAFTRNLFSAVGPARESEHPMEALAALLKSAQEIDFSKGRIALKAKPPEVASSE